MTRRTIAFAVAAPLALASWLAPPVSAQLDSGAAGGSSHSVAAHAAAVQHIAHAGTASHDASADGAAAAGSSRDAAKNRVRPNALPVIRGEVGPGFTITIDQDTVPRGRYRFVVKDLSTAHNFHLTGPGVDESTTVPFTGRVAWRLRLVPGEYLAVCDPHSFSMKTSLTVTG